MALSALALNCTLKRGEQKSSTQKLLDEILKALAKYKVSGETVRVVDLEVKPGVTSDEGEGDDIRPCSPAAEGDHAYRPAVPPRGVRDATP